jgi:hypothetical protein
MIKTRHAVSAAVSGLAMFAVVSCAASTGATTGASTGATTSARPKAPIRAVAAAAPWPVTRLHYAPDGNYGSYGQYLPGADGFNLADVDSKSQLDSLPTGVRGLMWLADCGGATASFRSTVDAFAGDPKLFGFYVVDEPLPWNCPPANLLAEDNWIHAHVPGARTFAILENLGQETAPSFTGSYTPADSGLDLVGVDPYPVRSEVPSPTYWQIADYVKLVEAHGWPLSSIVPVYQTFGGTSFPDDADGHWVLPTVTQERRMLADWAAVDPHPVFDYAYSWGPQRRDTALNQSPGLQAVFKEKNAESR